MKPLLRSVFSKAMKDSATFRFTILHPIGGGSKSLTVPSISSSFSWTAKEICKAAGRGAIYIWVQGDLHRDIITDPDNSNKMADDYQPQKSILYYRAEEYY